LLAKLNATDSVLEFFAEEIFGAICRTEALDAEMGSEGDGTVVFRYAINRVLQAKPDAYPMIDCIRKTAEVLAMEDGDRTRFRYYVTRLVELSARLGHPKTRNGTFPDLLDPAWEPRFENAQEKCILEGALLTNKVSLVKKYARYFKVESNSTHLQDYVLASPPVAAIEGDDHGILQALLDHASVEPASYRYALRAPLLCAIAKGDQDLIDFILNASRCSLAQIVGVTPERKRHMFLVTPSPQVFDRMVRALDSLHMLGQTPCRRIFQDIMHMGNPEMVHHLLNVAVKIDGQAITCDEVCRTFNMPSNAWRANSWWVIWPENMVKLALDLCGSHLKTHNLRYDRCDGPGTKLMLKWHPEWLEDYQCLSYAASRDDIGLCRLLLDAGVNPNRPPSIHNCEITNFPPLVFAVLHEHTSLVRLLIERDLDIHANSAGEAALTAAHAQGLESMVSLLEHYLIACGCEACLELTRRKDFPTQYNVCEHLVYDFLDD
jgi:hypothetical protein